MATKSAGREPREYVSLFLRPLDQKRLPGRDTKRFAEEKRARAAVEATMAKRDYQQEEIEGPLLVAKLEAAGVTAEQRKKMQADADRAYADYKQLLGTDIWKTRLPIEVVHLLTDPPPPAECTDITVHICQNRVCVDQRLPVLVNDISVDAGFDGTLNRVGTDGFTAEDSVAGSSTWNWTYHRHSQTHEGLIAILAGAELVEDAVVHGAGMIFEVLYHGNQPYPNSGWAHGKDPVGLPPSWGHVQGFYRLRVRYQRPGQPWTTWYNGSVVNYLNHGPVESNVAATPNLFSGGGDPSAWSRDIGAALTETFQAGTLFTIEVELSYWMKGLGLEGEAAINYGMQVFPYLMVESCSYQYPDVITIDTRNYL